MDTTKHFRASENKLDGRALISSIPGCSSSSENECCKSEEHVTSKTRAEKEAAIINRKKQKGSCLLCLDRIYKSDL